MDARRAAECHPARNVEIKRIYSLPEDQREAGLKKIKDQSEIVVVLRE